MKFEVEKLKLKKRLQEMPLEEMMVDEEEEEEEAAVAEEVEGEIEEIIEAETILEVKNNNNL